MQGQGDERGRARRQAPKEQKRSDWQFGMNRLAERSVPCVVGIVPGCFRLVLALPPQVQAVAFEQHAGKVRQLLALGKRIELGVRQRPDGTTAVSAGIHRKQWYEAARAAAYRSAPTGGGGISRRASAGRFTACPASPDVGF